VPARAAASAKAACDCCWARFSVSSSLSEPSVSDPRGTATSNLSSRYLHDAP
jgi:hypothetical protein